MSASKVLAAALLGVTASFPSLSYAEGCPCGSNHAPAPVSIMGDHLHPEGGWMISYRYMYQEMKDHQGDSPGAAHQDEHMEGHHKHADHDHAPSPAPAGGHSHEMSMQMHMLDFMYGFSDSLTGMVMVPFQQMEMKHNLPHMPHRTRSEGLGDVAFSLIYGAYRDGPNHLLLAPGVTIPTGEVDGEDEYHGVLRKHPYHMKLGSGTLDLTPTATYRYEGSGWQVGSQVGGVIRLGRNREGYALGNRVRLNSWIGSSLGSGLGVTARVGAESWGDVRGKEEDQSISSSLFDPDEQSGHLIDAGLGLSYRGSGALTGHQIGVEFSHPLDQSVDEGIHEVDWSLTAGWSVTF